MTRSALNTQEILTRILGAFSNDLNVGGPGVVVSSSGSGADIRLKVRPLVSLKDADGNTRDYTSIEDVPLMPIGLGGWHISLDPQPGDVVWLIAADRALDDWKRDKTKVRAPSVDRSHSVTDVIALPTCWGSGAGGSVTIRRVSDGGPSLSLTAAGVTVDGNLDVSGVLRCGTSTAPITLNTHTHPVAGDTTGTPNPG